MPEIVPASTRVHVTRIRNVGTERLYRRAAWLAENKHRLAREVDGPDNPGGRNRLAVIAREIYAIDAELARRDHTHAHKGGSHANDTRTHHPFPLRV